MKTYICLFTIIFFVAGCSNVNKPLEVIPIKGYFVKNTVEDTGNLQCFVFEDPTSFSQICGMAVTMSTKPDIPDFNKVFVVAIVGKNTEHPTTINMVETKLEKDVLIISVAEEISDDELSYTLRPLTVAAVTKAGIKKVVFRKGGVNIFSTDL